MTVTMPFGRHKGVPLAEIDENYLGWLLSLENLRPWLRRAVEEELEERHEQARREREWEEWERRRDTSQDRLGAQREARGVDKDAATEIITTGYRTLAVKHHPDKGGDVRTMQKINGARDWLVAVTQGALEDGT